MRPSSSVIALCWFDAVDGGPPDGGGPFATTPSWNVQDHVTPRFPLVLVLTHLDRPTDALVDPWRTLIERGSRRPGDDG
jgi:hypothetical protein